MIGEVLDGRYQVTQVLSKGGFGVTFLAADTKRPGNPDLCCQAATTSVFRSIIARNCPR